MKTKTIFEWSLAGFLFALAAGCGSGASGGSAASNPSDPANLDGDAASVSMTFQAVSGTPAALTTTDATGATVDLSSASMTIERIDIKLPDGQSCSTLSISLPAFASCDDDSSDDNPSSDDSSDDDDKIRLNGPFTVDLLTGTSTPSLADITLPSGIVREIKVRVADLAAAGSVDGAPFSLNLNFHEDIEFHDVSGFEISEAVSLNQVVISFDVSKWLSGVNLASCGSGTVKVDDESDDSCSEIEDEIRDNIEHSGSASEDDHSGEDDGADDEIGDDNGTDDPATHDVGDDNGVDDPSTDDVVDDNGGNSGSGSGA